MSDIEETQATEERPQLKMFFEAESTDRLRSRRNQIRERYDKSPEKLFQVRWFDRVVRQDIWLAAKKFWDDRSTNRDKAHDVSIMVVERCAGWLPSSPPPYTDNRQTKDFATRLAIIEREQYHQRVTGGDVEACYQFWCFVEMLAFGVTPSDLLVIWQNTEKCASAQSGRMDDFMNSLPNGMVETAEHKAERMKIQNFDDENPVISDTLLPDIWRWTKLYLEAGYPTHYVVERRSILYLGKPQNPDVSEVRESQVKLHSLKYYLYYGIKRLADAAKPKPRYKPSFLGRPEDFFMVDKVPDLTTMWPNNPNRTSPATENNHPYLYSLAQTFYKRASVNGKLRIHVALESLIVLRTMRRDHVIEDFIAMVETSCFGKEITEGPADARRAFWRLIYNAMINENNKEQPERLSTTTILYASAVDMIMRGANPRHYCAMHLHGRGGLSTPIRPEDYTQLPTAERELYQQIFMVMVASDPRNVPGAPF